MCSKIFLLGFFTFFSVQCAHVTAESSFAEKGLERAAFDLGCPKDQLNLQVLHRNDGLGCADSQMGVSGCGKRTVYVCTSGQQWIRNSEIQSTSP
jgi:hypothetical protein